MAALGYPAPSLAERSGSGGTRAATRCRSPDGSTSSRPRCCSARRSAAWDTSSTRNCTVRPRPYRGAPPGPGCIGLRTRRRPMAVPPRQRHPQGRSRLLAEPTIHPDITAAIGGTPLVALDRLAKGVPGRVVAKLEAMNPGGSVKDRIALPMIEAAGRAGLLKPGGAIVGPPTGNTGGGLAVG